MMQITTEGKLNASLFFATFVHLAGEKYSCETEIDCVRFKRPGETGMGVPVNQPPQRRKERSE